MRFSLFAAAALVMAPAAGYAAPAILTFDSDTAFILFESGGAYANRGNASTLWGNAGPSGAFEYAIRGVTDGIVLAQGQIDWSSGDHDLRLDRAGNPYVSYSSAGAVDFDFRVTEVGANPNGDPTGDYGLSANIGAGVNAVFFRARTPAAGTANASFEGISVSYGMTSIDLGDVIGDGDAQYVGLVDADLANGFTVTIDRGTFNFGTGLATALPALQVKFGTAVITNTPAPAALALFGLGLAALGLRRRA